MVANLGLIRQADRNLKKQSDKKVKAKKMKGGLWAGCGGRRICGCSPDNNENVHCDEQCLMPSREARYKDSDIQPLSCGSWRSIDAAVHSD